MKEPFRTYAFQTSNVVATLVYTE